MIGINVHDAGVGMSLIEGNNMNGFLADTYHGTSNFQTVFRNWFSGRDNANKTGNTVPIKNQA